MVKAKRPTTFHIYAVADRPDFLAHCEERFQHVIDYEADVSALDALGEGKTLFIEIPEFDMAIVVTFVAPEETANA